MHVARYLGRCRTSRRPAPALGDGGSARELLGMPLLREGEPSAPSRLPRTRCGRSPTSRSRCVQTFADQAVIAIENVRLFDEVQARTRELTEALEQQTATSEVLQVISGSPDDLAPVFEAMLAKATQLCNARLGIMLHLRGRRFTIAAERGTPAPSSIFGDKPVRPGPATASQDLRSARARVVHIPDMMDDGGLPGRRPERTASVTGSGRELARRAAAARGHAARRLHVYRAEPAAVLG